MSYRYRMTLRPLAPFFFGGEHTFGADEARKEGSRYYAKSTHFPQQSALLGMLRKTMLTKAGYMTMHKKGEWVDGREGDTHARAKSLCGDGSFSYEKAFDMGSIITLSPLFIHHKGHDYTLAPKDADFTPRFTQEKMLIGDRVSDSIIFDGYDPKEFQPPKLLSANGAPLLLDKIFRSVESVGIRKSRDGVTQDDAFFMKRSYRFERETQFAALLETSEPMKWRQSMVALGADQSPFMLTLEEWTGAQYDKLFAPIVTPKPIGRVVALSDMLLSREAYDSARFVFGSRLTTRYIVRDGKDKDKGYQPKKSTRYYLIERGSILYTDDLKALEDTLDIRHLQRVGLNHYTTTQGEQ